MRSTCLISGCGHCKNAKPKFEDSAKGFESSPDHVFAVVDCNTDSGRVVTSHPGFTFVHCLIYFYSFSLKLHEAVIFLQLACSARDIRIASCVRHVTRNWLRNFAKAGRLLIFSCNLLRIPPPPSFVTCRPFGNVSLSLTRSSYLSVH